MTYQKKPKIDRYVEHKNGYDIAVEKTFFIGNYFFYWEIGNKHVTVFKKYGKEKIGEIPFGKHNHRTIKRVILEWYVAHENN
jgi:hypothetical protein